MVGDDTTAEVFHRVALWLSLAILGLRDNAMAELFYLRMVGHERMGVALDKVLNKLKDDSPRPAALLRVQLRKIGKELRDGNDEDLLVDAADLYTVADPADFGTGAGIDEIYDWLRQMSLTRTCWTRRAT